MKILLVDDERSLLEQAKIFLEKMDQDLDVKTVSSAEDALDMIEEEDLDLIVSDYQMPGTDGLKFLRIIREEWENDIPFIMFTGKGREEVAMEALNLGGDRYLQKGGDPKSQYGVLAQAIKQEAMHYETEVLHKEKQKELKDLKEEYETIFRNVQSNVFLMDVEDGEFKFQRLNPLHERLTGLKTEEVRGKTPVEILGKEVGERVEQNYRECLERKEPIAYEEELELPEGKKTWFTTLAPVMDDGEVKKIVGSSMDITEQKETEKRLKKAVEIIEKSPFVAYIWKDEESWPVEFFSSNVERVFGYTKEEFTSGEITYEDCIHPDDRERVKKDIKNYREEGRKEFEHEPYRIITKDGETRIVKDWKFIEKDPEGDKIRYKGTIRDITEEKETEKTLQELKQNYQELFEKSAGALFVHDPDTAEILNVNQKMCEMYGYSREEALKLTIGDLSSGVYPYTQEEAKKRVQKAKEEGPITFEWQGQKKNGALFWKEVTLKQAEIGGESRILASVRDISGRKKAEKQIEERKKKLEKLHQISANLETCRFKDEIYDLTVKVAEDILDFDTCVINKPEDEWIKPLAYSSEFPEDGYPSHDSLPIDDSLAGKTYSENKSFLIKTAEDYEVMNPTSENFRSGLSVPIGQFAVFQAASTVKKHFDEEDLKMAELLIDHVSEALERVEMEEREEFLHSLLRHDVKNKIQILKGYLQLLEEDVKLPDEATDYIQKAKKVTKLSDEIIEKVRKLKQIKQEDEIKEIDMDSVLEQILTEHKDQAEKKGIDIEVQISGCKVKGGTLLQEAISNLIENSIKHSDCDKIRIKDECEEDVCVVTVEDDGKGIPYDIKEKIFERGFKEGENASSGLGMYLVKEIVESYGGSIEVKDSELGGARFDVHLNRAYKR